MLSSSNKLKTKLSGQLHHCRHTDYCIKCLEGMVELMGILGMGDTHRILQG